MPTPFSEPTPLGVERGRVRALGVGRIGIFPRGGGRDRSHALNRPGESMSMTISSSSPGIPILIPNSSPQAYGGVGYSFIGREDSEVLARLLQLIGRLGEVAMIDPSFACDRALGLFVSPSP
jgi:hypothetical protein